MEKVYGYARVSTREQNLDRQIAALRQYIADERDIITDKESGKDFNRPGYQYLREALLRPGDTLIVKSLDRLGRNKQQVKQELEYYKTMGVRVKIIDLPSTMADFPKGQEWICEMVNNIRNDRRAGAPHHPPAAGRGHRRGDKAGAAAWTEKD